MISAPTRTPKNLSLDRIKEFRIAGYSARADVGADTIRPRRPELNRKAVHEREYLSGQPFFANWFLRVLRLKALANLADERKARDRLGRNALDQTHEVLGHDARVERLDGSFLQLFTEVRERGQMIQLSALTQRAAPGEDGRHGVGAGLFALQILVIMPGDRAVRSLELEVAVGRDEHARHHRKAAKRGADHVAHHVAVVVFASPDVAALGADHAGYRVVDQRVKVGEPRLIELRFIVRLKDLLKDIFKRVIILLADRVLGGKPKILLRAQRVLEAAVRKGANRAILIIHTLQHAGALEVVDRLAETCPVFTGEHQLRLAFFRHAIFRCAVDVAIRVTRDGDGLFPRLDHGLHSVDQDRRAEDGSVENCADGAVRALPNLAELVFLHALRVRRYGCALDADAVFLDRVGGVRGDLILRLFALRKA